MFTADGSNTFLTCQNVPERAKRTKYLNKNPQVKKDSQEPDIHMIYPPSFLYIVDSIIIPLSELIKHHHSEMCMYGLIMFIHGLHMFVRLYVCFKQFPHCLSYNYMLWFTSIHMITCAHISRIYSYRCCLINTVNKIRK